jgi:hypothetical protein
MMKAILGSALGGLAAGTLALVASAQGRSMAPADPWAMQAATAPRALTVADMRGVSAATTNTPTLVQCEPQQEALLRRSFVSGREVAEVTCVSTRGAYNEAAPVDARTAYSQSDIVTAPAIRTQTVQPRTVERVVYREPRAAASTRQSVDVKKRSWKQTALIIGGSAGAGAGIGAIAGGKKGALIGAAIGGGAASIYEVSKRR